MLDETVVTAIPPLVGAYGKVGEAVEVPIEGSHTERRVLHAALSLHSGDVLLWITQEGVKGTHQDFLKQVRSHWRGWISALSPRQRLKKAGVLSPAFWLRPPIHLAKKPNPH